MCVDREWKWPVAQSGLQSLYTQVPSPIAVFAVQVSQNRFSTTSPTSAQARTISCGSTLGVLQSPYTFTPLLTAARDAVSGGPVTGGPVGGGGGTVVDELEIDDVGTVGVACEWP